MSHVDVSYKKIASRKERDEKAIQDVRDWLTVTQWEALLVTLGSVAQAHKMQPDPRHFQSINFACGFMGISGYPVFALGRKWCLDAYRAWMASDVGGEPTETDEEGFTNEDYHHGYEG